MAHRTVKSGYEELVERLVALLEEVFLPFDDGGRNLQQGFVMLDGGLATELENRGADLDDDLWSAKMLIESPELIRQVHLAHTQDLRQLCQLRQLVSRQAGVEAGELAANSIDSGSSSGSIATSISASSVLPPRLPESGAFPVARSRGSSGWMLT